jgi:predicted PurR-regulated permease PerM
LSFPAIENAAMEDFAGKATVVLAVIASVFLLYWGAPFFIPLLVALLIAYALSPVTDLLTGLVRWRVLAATIVVASVMGLLGTAAWAWSDDVAALWQRVPEAAHRISGSVKKIAQRQSSVAEVKKAAAEIEAIAQTGKASPPPPAPNASPGKSFWEIAWEGGKTMAGIVMQVLVVIFLVFFMLASGDLFKRKIVRLYGDTLTEKKVTVQMIDEIDLQIRRYLGVMLISNCLVGIGTYIGFRVMGVNYPELWGVFAAIVHTAPYFGPAIVAAGSLVAAFMQFGDWSHAFLVAGVTIFVATLVGSVFATWLSARQTHMNTTATFVGLLFFGWIWGLWGILLAIPLLAIVKSICERSETWKPIAELLAREEPAKRLPAEEEKSGPSPVRDGHARP